MKGVSLPHCLEENASVGKSKLDAGAMKVGEPLPEAVVLS